MTPRSSLIQAHQGQVFLVYAYLGPGFLNEFCLREFVQLPSSWLPSCVDEGLRAAARYIVSGESTESGAVP